METIHRVEQISFERAISILDTQPDSAAVALAQQRLKALIGVGCATLARQAASADTLGQDAARFLTVLAKELSK